MTTHEVGPRRARNETARGSRHFPTAPCFKWRALLLVVAGAISSPAHAQCQEWFVTAESLMPVPPGRNGTAMVYDSSRNLLTLYGGVGPAANGGAGGDFDDTWEFDGNLWLHRDVPGPPARRRHAMAFDSQRGVSVVFGGALNNARKRDTWEWDGQQWTLKSTTGPSARDRTRMAFDSQRGVTVLFGGDTGGLNRETWEWNGSDWTLRSTSGPSARQRHAMAYDPVRGVTVLFGGWDGVVTERLGNGMGPTGRSDRRRAPRPA